VAAYVLCRDDDGRILLTRFVAEGNPRSGWWTMPGGGMEWGEQAAEAARRELDEETGLVADIGPVLAVRSEWMEPSESRLHDRFHSVQIIFAASNVRGALRTDFADGGTTDAAAWYTLDEARALPHVGLVDACLDLCDELSIPGTTQVRRCGRPFCRAIDVIRHRSRRDHVDRTALVDVGLDLCD
jgi:ADP-ribose pyrophosphatase YjhB (NUDIX family)